MGLKLLSFALSLTQGANDTRKCLECVIEIANAFECSAAPYSTFVSSTLNNSVFLSFA